MKKIYSVNNSNGETGLFLGLKSRITTVNPLLTMLALLMVCLFGVNEKAWADPTYCNYNYTKNEETTSIHNGEVIYRATINGSYYGLSKLTFKISMSRTVYLDNRSKDLAYDIYLYNNSTNSWSKRESKTLSGYGATTATETITYTTDLTDISAFKVVSTTDFGTYKSWGTKYDTYRSVSVSNVAFQMASTVSASTEAINFGDVTYGNNKSESVTAYYTLNYADNMTATCTGDYTATITAGCNCSTSQQSKTITVKFTPTQAGTRNGTLTISNPDGTNTTVSLSGTGVRANPTLNMSNNGSVNVTTDKANPVTLDLAGLKLNSSTSGIGGFSKFELQSVDASTGAKANGVTINGSTFSSTVGGTYTVRATTAQNNQYNSTYKDFTVTVNRKEQTISWNPENLETEPFVEEDEVTATSIGDVTLEKSGKGAEYISIDGNKATVLEVGAASTVTLTATAAQTDVYAQATDSKTISLTSLAKQHITFDDNLTKLKTTDETKKKKLTATSDSNRDSEIYYTCDTNDKGVYVAKEDGKWYLYYTATPAKGIAVTAHLDGVAGTYVAASDVSQMVKVTDPTAVCDVTETLSSAYGLKSTSKTYDLTIPKKVVLKIRCSEKSLTLLNGYDIKFYKGNTQVGETHSYGVDDGHYYNQDVKTRTFDNLDRDITKVVVTSNASKGYDITEASYERYSYADPSVSELNYEAYALSTVADQSFTVNYANYQIELSIEGSSNFVIKSEDSFGDCETYGSETVTVGYNVPAVKCEETATLYIKDNAGNTLNTVTLNANVLGGLTQNITSTNIKTSYLTTDSAHLNATTDRGLKNFTYSASPAGVASFDGNVMTFSQSGTIAITVTEAGNATFNEATTTVNNVVVCKAVPNIAENPSVATIKYKDSFANGLFSGGKATVTLRGVANTEVAGTFSWTNSGNVTDGQGSHDYSVTFTPENGNMYAPKVFTLPVTVSRANGGIVMKDGKKVKVHVAGLNDASNEWKIDLDTIIQSKITDAVANRAGGVTYEVISANSAKASIDDKNIFSATEVGTYTLRATQAETDYYTLATDDFDIVVEKVVPTFSGTDGVSLKVAGVQNNAFSFTNVETLVPHITHHINAINNGDGQVIEYDAEHNTIIAHNAGTAEIYFTQAETETNAGGTSAVFHYTVTKHEPKFTWNKNNKEYYYESTIANIFETSNSATDTTVTSNNPTAAYVENNTLHILNVEENTTFSIYQAENYYWAAKDTSITITPEVTDNHVTFTIDEDNKDYMVTINNTDYVKWDNDGYKMGNSINGIISKAPETYVIISFTGTPDKLTFTKTCDRLLGFLPVTGECLFEVYESANGEDWGSPIWSFNEEEESRDVTDVPPLNPTSRYLKLRYHGTICGHFNNIKVTELKRFNADKEIVDFGLQGAAYGVQEMQLNFTHANAGRTTNMEIVGPDAAYFSVEPNVLPETGRDITGTVNFHITFDNGSDRRGTNSYNAELVFTDNLGHEERVALTGVRDGLSVPTFTFNPNNLPYYYGSTIANIAVSSNTDYTNCPLSYSSTDPTIAYIDETGLHITQKAGEVTITVHQGEGGEFREWSEEFSFTPSERPALHTPFVVTSDVLNGAGKKGDCSWTDGYVKLGKYEPFNYDEKSFTLVFDGMPDSLSFQIACQSSISTGVAKWEVKESADGAHWTQVWLDGSYSSTDWSDLIHYKLKENTRYLQFFYRGNYAGYWKNVKVTGIDGYAFLRAGDGQYLSRGADWSTRAIVDEYGVACRITRTTDDNTNYKTRLQFVDSEQYLFEDGDAIYTDHSGRTPIYWNIVENAGTVTIQSANNTSHNGHYVKVNENGVLAFTAEESEATHWYKDGPAQYKNYITDILDRQATAAAQYDFEGLTTLAAVRKELNENEYDFNVIDVPAVAEYIEQKGEYRNGAGEIQNNYEYVAEDLIPGFYKLTVQGFNRMGSQKAAYTMFANNMESSLAYIYANDVKYPIMSLLDESGRRAVASPTGTDKYYDNGYFYADDREAALVSFSNEKAYLNDVYVYVDADEGKETGTLRYGIKNTSYIAGAWLIYGNIKLNRLARAEYVFNPDNNDKTWGESDNWNREDGKTPTDQSVVVVKKDADITGDAAVYSLTIYEDVTVTVKSGATLTIGNSNPYPRTTYGNLHVEDGGRVILKDGELRVNDFFLDASIGSISRSASSGQVNGEETNLKVRGESYFQICFDPVAISYGWYDFVLPFDVDVIGGIYLPSDLNTPLVNNVDFAIMEFSEADRAANKKAWHWFSGTLKAGKLYTITLDETQPSRTTYVFKKKASAELGAANTYNAECTTSAPATDRGWNGLGNGTLRYCQLNTESLPDDAKMQIYDHNNDCYKPCEATEYTYAIGTAFFIQVNENNQTITLDTVADSRAFRAPSRDMRSVEEFRLALKAEDTEYTLDNLWISASEEATEEYEIGKDLLKMGTPTSAKTAQMWATKGGLKLCDIETRMEGNGASSDLNLYVPQAGMYELEVEKMPEDATLYLTYNGRAIWVLSASPYMLDLNAGVTEGYGLRIEAQAPQVATGFENGGLLNDTNNVRKVVIDNTIYIITPEGKMYDIVGKSVKY